MCTQNTTYIISSHECNSRLYDNVVYVFQIYLNIRHTVGTINGAGTDLEEKLKTLKSSFSNILIYILSKKKTHLVNSCFHKKKNNK